MLNLLKQHYPSQLMPQLALYSQAALEDCVAAFPSQRKVESSGLQSFITAVEVHAITKPNILIACSGLIGV